MKLLAPIEKLSRPIQISLGLALIGIVGFLDSLTGYEISFSLFYVIPIGLVGWLTSRRFGIIFSLISALVWLGADLSPDHYYSHPLIPIWNSLIRLAFFILITVLLAEVKRMMAQEKELAHTDFLTGAVNSRLFFSLAQMEIDRSVRYKNPFTLAYIDLDNFKTVNDQLGHSTGDEVLRTVVHTSKALLRRTDIMARLGGDEFAMLLPDTDQPSAEVVLQKIQQVLLEEMRRKNLPVTFSIGALTCTSPPSSTDELVQLADGLMYSVKRTGKNAIKYATYPA